MFVEGTKEPCDPCVVWIFSFWHVGLPSHLSISDFTYANVQVYPHSQHEVSASCGTSSTDNESKGSDSGEARVDRT